RDLVKTCLASSGIDTESVRFPKPDVLVEVFSYALNTRSTIREVIATQYDYFDVIAAEIEKLGALYQARKRETNVMDFDDLLALWLRLLQEHESARERYQ